MKHETHSLIGVKNVPIIRRHQGQDAEACEDPVAVEEPLEIRVEGRVLAVVMRTPGHDHELAVGFLLSEGVVKSAKDIFDVTTCVQPGVTGAGNAVDVALTHPQALDFDKMTRHVFTSSSCGICGKASIESVLRRRKPIRDPLQVEAGFLLRLPERLGRQQETFKMTGGLHACALFDAEGALIEVREDVGRHNALDKLLGWALLGKRLPLHGYIALLSGRASFEMVQKAYVAGIPLVAAISAPSSLAVEFARESGQTLVGFLRNRSLNVYAGVERVVTDMKAPAS